MDILTNNTSQGLRSLPIFGKSPENVFEELSEASTSVNFAKGETIFREGDASDRIYFLLNGSVKIGRHSSDSREVIKQVLHPITMFGELGLVGESERQDFAIALSKEVLVQEMPLSQFNLVMRKHYNLAMGIMEWVGHRLRNTESRLESLIFKDARQRIIDFIIDNAEKRGRRVGYETLIKHSLTQQDIANITGTSRQTVTSVFNDLRKSNLIYFNRRSILIRDLAKLS